MKQRRRRRRRWTGQSHVFMYLGPFSTTCKRLRPRKTLGNINGLVLYLRKFLFSILFYFSFYIHFLQLSLAASISVGCFCTFFLFSIFPSLFPLYFRTLSTPGEWPRAVVFDFTHDTCEYLRQSTHVQSIITQRCTIYCGYIYILIHRSI